MIGHYKLDCNGHQGSVLTLYMVDANNLVAPTVGICDVGRSEGSYVEDEHYLFIFRRKDDWVSSWDSMINKRHQSRDSPTDKSEYKEDANDDLNNEEDSDNNKVDEEGADEEEEDCSDDNNSNEADADDEEEEEEGADEELADGNDKEVVCPPPMNWKKRRR
jgi:hypothetical protein